MHILDAVAVEHWQVQEMSWMLQNNPSTANIFTSASDQQPIISVVWH